MAEINFTRFETPDLAEAAFYQAFAHCDIQAMTAIWAHEDVVCIHPGSDALLGHDAVMTSWASIFSGAEPPALNYNVIRKVINDDLAVHVVQEFIASPDSAANGDTHVVLATNVFRKGNDGGWHLLAHHASVPRITIETDADQDLSSFNSSGRHTLQ